MRPPLGVEEAVRGVLAGDRAVIGRTLTLVESTHPEHRERAKRVLAALTMSAGTGFRVGVSGVPGAGKSTFLDALGVMLLERGHRVAVLSVDPTSGVSGGSILGDKTRMARLSISDAAFVRPSPSGGELGGVTRTTRESIVVLEAAGFDVCLVETVGVGQSETAVSRMVDTFLVLTLTGGGDDLQGIKRGILELVDVLVVHKADGPNVDAAVRTRRELEGALHLLRGGESGRLPPVLTCSSMTGDGLDAVWAAVLDHRSQLEQEGGVQARRDRQKVAWAWQLAEDEVLRAFRHHPAVRALRSTWEEALAGGEVDPQEAAAAWLAAYRTS
jgi:LAO/AO transport system kinase